MKKHEEIVVSAFVSAVLLQGAVDQLLPDTSDIEHPSNFAGSYEVRGISSTMATFPILPDFLG